MDHHASMTIPAKLTVGAIIGREESAESNEVDMSDDGKSGVGEESPFCCPFVPLPTGQKCDGSIGARRGVAILQSTETAEATIKGE